MDRKKKRAGEPAEAAVRVMATNDIIHAEMTKGMLESGGIPCRILNESTFRTQAYLAPMGLTLELVVPAGRAEEARRIIAALQSETR